MQTESTYEMNDRGSSPRVDEKMNTTITPGATNRLINALEAVKQELADQWGHWVPDMFTLWRQIREIEQTIDKLVWDVTCPECGSGNIDITHGASTTVLCHDCGMTSSETL